MPHSAQDLAVSGDGVAITGAGWIESGHDVHAYTRRGTPVGPEPGSSVGRFRETGGGPLAVEATNSHLYAAQELHLVRWDRSKFMGWDPYGGVYQGRTLTIRSSGGGRLLGLTVCRGDAYVVDPGGPQSDTTNMSPDGAMVKVVDADLTGGVKRQWTVPRARHLACDRQGNIWVLQQRWRSASARLARYSPTGSLLTAFDVSGEPMDVAAHPNLDQVWVPDNGRDQRVEKYGYTGAPAGTLGRSYLSGPTPGLVGPRRFAGPRGVDIDSAGNAYVAQAGIPGRGRRGWNDLGKLVVLSKFSRSGAQVWRREGLVKASTGEPSSDDSRFYADVVSYDKRRGRRWRFRAFTLDPFANPDDHRYQTTLSFEDTTSSQVRDIRGHRYVYSQSAVAGRMTVYRLDGELLTQVDELGGVYIDIEGRPRKDRPASIPDNCVARDFFAQANGDIWMLCQDNGGVWRYRVTGYTSGGAPIYRWSAVDVYPMPPQIAGGNAGRIEVDGTNVYVSGHAPGETSADPDPWLWMGRRIVKFPNLPRRSRWPTPAWNRTVFYGDEREKPVQFAVDRDRIAVGYQGCVYPKFTGGCLRIYSTSNGNQLGGAIKAPGILGHVGWLDLYRPISFRNGRIYVEDDHLSKLWSVAP